MTPDDRPIWRPAYVALGSNLEDPEAQVRSALVEIADIPGSRLMMRSALYRSGPMGPRRQPDFINAVAALLTTLDAPQLLDSLHSIEKAHGRCRKSQQRWGPRTLDLDILALGDLIICCDGLTIPHPGIAERNFVLFPLASIVPDLVIPGLGRVEDLARRIGSEGLERLDRESCAE